MVVISSSSLHHLDYDSDDSDRNNNDIIINNDSTNYTIMRDDETDDENMDDDTIMIEECFRLFDMDCDNRISMNDLYTIYLANDYEPHDIAYPQFRQRIVSLLSDSNQNQNTSRVERQEKGEIEGEEWMQYLSIQQVEHVLSNVSIIFTHILLGMMIQIILLSIRFLMFLFYQCTQISFV